MSEKRYKLEILTPAQRELEEIALVHLELVGPQSARNITNRIYDSLARLQTTPYIGVDCANKPLGLPGYRMLICGNYLCIYRLIGDSVFVYHIVDGRRDYPKLMNDLEQ
jgi:Plasmid stabilization system protein